MLTSTATFQMLTDAIERSALRQAVYSANIANANVAGYRRMEVAFDTELERARLAMSSMDGAQVPPATMQVVATSDGVKLDEEMGLMARNALQYQVLLGAFDGQMGLLRLAVREGRGQS